MSRSFKKTPITKCAGYGSYGKKLANKKVRRNENDVFANGNLYKKIYETWDINDCITRMTQKDAEQDGMLADWEKFYHRK